MIRTYDPGLIALSIAGIPISGYAKGTFVKVERKADTFALTVGSGGESARVRSRDQSGKITITLMQSSPTNDLLSALAVTDEQNGDGVGAFLGKDLNGTTLIHADSAWITKIADTENADEIKDREWVFETPNLDVFVGGNNITVQAT